MLRNVWEVRKLAALKGLRVERAGGSALKGRLRIRLLDAKGQAVPVNDRADITLARAAEYLEPLKDVPEKRRPPLLPD